MLVGDLSKHCTLDCIVTHCVHVCISIIMYVFIHSAAVATGNTRIMWESIIYLDSSSLLQHSHARHNGSSGEISTPLLNLYWCRLNEVYPAPCCCIIMTVVYLTTQRDHGPVSRVGRLPPVQADDPLTRILFWEDNRQLSTLICHDVLQWKADPEVMRITKFQLATVSHIQDIASRFEIGSA